MRRLIAFAALAFFAGASLFSGPARAQVFIVAACGTVPASQATLTAGNPGMMFIDTNGRLCGATTATLQTQGYVSPLSITRPANQTPYTANDNVGGALTFPSLGPSAGGDVMLTSAELELDITAIPAGMTSFRLYLYNVTPPSALADNAAWDLPSGDRASYLGYVDLGSPVDLGSTLYVRADGINAQFRLAVGGSVFGYLVTNGGFTPAANSEVYKVTLHAIGL